jgi:hypothetical protein
MEYKYPKELVDFLTEQEGEGSEIFTTQNSDSTIWIITYPSLKDYVSIIEWYQQEDTYTHVNLMDKALKRFKMVIKELENK